MLCTTCEEQSSNHRKVLRNFDIDWQMTYNVNGRPPLVGKFFSLCIGFMLSIPPRRLGQGEYQLLWQRRHVISAVSEVYKKLLLAPFCSPSLEHQVFQDVGLTTKVQKNRLGYSSFILTQAPLHLSILFLGTLVLVFKPYIGFIWYQDGALPKCLDADKSFSPTLALASNVSPVRQAGRTWRRPAVSGCWARTPTAARPRGKPGGPG